MENMTLEIENYLLKRQLKEKNKKIFTLEIEKELAKQELDKKERELELANDLINNYYRKGKHDVNSYLSQRKEQELSDDAKRFIRDIERGLDDEEVENF